LKSLTKHQASKQSGWNSFEMKGERDPQHTK